MSNTRARLLLAHGAGQDSTSPFMQILPTLLQPADIEVLLFDFDYMIKARQTGTKRPPERLPKLQAQFKAQISQHQKNNTLPLFIGGKSMGGRVASTLIEEVDGVIGAICLGFPFHPPGKIEKLRLVSLQNQTKPTLILQGTRDPFGKRDEVLDYALSEQVAIRFIEDGDHSFKPRKSSGLTWQQNMIHAAREITHFIKQNIGLDATRPR